jgi:6-pyruvoyltetrahydropterin/6-carboxytetrahydropterin synthase
MQHYTSTKAYYDFPCAHRQWKSQTHCKNIHGYSRSFHFEFGCYDLDECGFVVDFGGLKPLKEHLDYMFDHTLLINADDPLCPVFQQLDKAGACMLRTISYGIGMEGTARYLCEYADKLVRTLTNHRCWVIQVEARENSKNSAIYHNPNSPHLA